MANTGPGLNSNSFGLWLKTLTPVTSVGQQVGRELQAGERQVERTGERLREDGLPHPGKSSMIRCPSAKRQRTQSSSVSCGARTARSRFSTTRATTSAAGRDAAGPSAGAASVIVSESNRSTSSRTATATTSFGAFSIVCSPSSKSSTTSLSAASKPMSARLTSLKTTRSVFFARRFARARSRPGSAPSAAKPTSTCPFVRPAPSVASTSVVGSSSTVQGSSSLGRFPVDGAAGR